MPIESTGIKLLSGDLSPERPNPGRFLIFPKTIATVTALYLLGNTGDEIKLLATTDIDMAAITTAIAGKVSLTGNETIAGDKTFSGKILAPTTSSGTPGVCGSAFPTSGIAFVSAFVTQIIHAGTVRIGLNTAGGAFTGNFTAATQSPGDNSTRLSTTAYTDAAVAAGINALVGGAGAALDTLYEIANSLGNNANLSTALTTSIAGKVSLTGNESIAGLKTFTNDSTVLATNTSANLTVFVSGATGNDTRLIANGADPAFRFYLGASPSAVFGANVIQLDQEYAGVQMGNGNFHWDRPRFFFGDYTTGVTDGGAAKRVGIIADSVEKVLVTGNVANLKGRWTGGTCFIPKTSTYTAVVGEQIMANTAGGAFTINLPATPSANDRVDFADALNTWGTNNLTIGRNGSNIESNAGNWIADLSGQRLLFVYSGDATVGWRVFITPGNI